MSYLPLLVPAWVIILAIWTIGAGHTTIILLFNLRDLSLLLREIRSLTDDLAADRKRNNMDVIAHLKGADEK